MKEDGREDQYYIRRKDVTKEVKRYQSPFRGNKGEKFSTLDIKKAKPNGLYISLRTKKMKEKDTQTNAYKPVQKP